MLYFWLFFRISRRYLQDKVRSNSYCIRVCPVYLVQLKRLSEQTNRHYAKKVASGQTEGRRKEQTNGRANGRTDESTNERPDGSTNIRLNQRTNERTDGRTDKRTQSKIHAHTDKRTNELLPLLKKKRCKHQLAKINSKIKVTAVSGHSQLFLLQDYSGLRPSPLLYF